VDSSNPAAAQQIASVDKILTELELNEIPQVIVLNKVDLTDEQMLEPLVRQISLDKGVRHVAVSAIRPNSLRALVEAVSETIAIQGPVADISTAAP
jgi:GTP-binding protein HflX